MPASTRRLAGVALALSAWLLLLFSGVALGGAVHLLLLVALAAFPWRELRPVTPAAGGPLGKEKP
jgi:hypothetical protein